MGTVIVDFYGVYGPRILNDRLLLGLRGTNERVRTGGCCSHALQVVIPELVSKLFPKRCPKCRGLINEERTRVFEGESFGSFCLQPVTFIQHTCQRFDYDRRELRPEEDFDALPYEQRWGTGKLRCYPKASRRPTAVG